MQVIDNVKYLTRIEAAKMIGISPGSMAVWASLGKKNLPYHRFGKLCYYKELDLIAYVESTRRGGKAV